MSKSRGTDTPTRTCVGCGSRDRQSAMVRLRRDAAGTITADTAVRAGRSAYVHGRSECVRGIVRSKVLGKSLRQNVAKETRLALMSVLERELVSVVERELASVVERETTSVLERQRTTESNDLRGAGE